MKPPEIWDPFWLKGVIRSHAVTNKMAGAAYTMDEATLVLGTVSAAHDFLDIARSVIRML
jgi:hypothetical protein